MPFYPFRTCATVLHPLVRPVPAGYMVPAGYYEHGVLGMVPSIYHNMHMYPHPVKRDSPFEKVTLKCVL